MSCFCPSNTSVLHTKVLLEYKASVAKTNKFKVTPLHLAAKYGRPTQVKKVMQRDLNHLV